MSTYKITLILFFCFFLIRIQAGEIHGKITLKTPDGIVTASGQAFVGDTNYMPGVTFPPFLKAQADALGSERFSEIDNDGKFVFKNVPEGKTLIVGVWFHKVHYCYVVTLGEDEVFDLTKEIDTTIDKSDVLVSIEGESERTQHERYGRVAFLFESGNEGFVVMSLKKEGSIIKFRDVRHGNYVLAVLSAPNESGPNTVDQMPVLVDSNLVAPIALEIAD